MLEKMRVSSGESACKCCGGISRLCGVVDFSRCGADHQAGKKVEPYAGVPIYYHRCDACGFTFTKCMDTWTPQDFSTHIYNDDYVRHDPDYLGARPIQNAEWIARYFPDIAQTRILDFGSGLGLLEKELKARGFPQVDSYDPYTSEDREEKRREEKRREEKRREEKRREEKRREEKARDETDGTDVRRNLAQCYRTIVSFEVFEHHPDPHELMSGLKKFLADEGVILFSTLFIADEVFAQGLEKWWYCAPRNGHISFFTPRALAVLAEQHGLAVGSFTHNHHFFYNGSIPSWIAKYNHTAHKR